MKIWKLKYTRQKLKNIGFLQRQNLSQQYSMLKKDFGNFEESQSNCGEGPWLSKFFKVAQNTVRELTE